MKPQWQKLRGAGHPESVVKKQRTMNDSALLHFLLFSFVVVVVVFIIFVHMYVTCR